MKAVDSFCQTFGLHPFVGFSLFAVDSALFASEVVTIDATWALTIPLGLALTIPAILLQKQVYGDSWRAAVGKGLIVGILTAIPLPIASLITLTGGVLGTVRGLRSNRAEEKLIKG
jgi:hypothetical protein